MTANGYVADKGLAAVEATLKSGIEAGMTTPHEDLREQPDEQPDEQPGEQASAFAEAPPAHPRCTRAEVHSIFKRWFGEAYDTDVIDAVMAAAAAERLAGDPLWLLVISGPGNTKTETVQSLAGCGAHVSSTISSEGALLSASPRKSRAKTATGGLLRKIGDRGILVIKDVTSILSADRNTRAGVLAALREVYDGRWERNVGTDGGQTLTWTGRIAVVGAVTTAWDVAHAVVSVMGDRFVSIRSDSTVGRAQAGVRAIRNTGGETAMRAEIVAAVGGLIGHIDADQTWPLEDDEIEQLVAAADIVTYARTAVERDFRGDVINSHAPEMPTGSPSSWHRWCAAASPSVWTARPRYGWRCAAPPTACRSCGSRSYWILPAIPGAAPPTFAETSPSPTAPSVASLRPCTCWGCCAVTRNGPSSMRPRRCGGTRWPPVLTAKRCSP